MQMSLKQMKRSKPKESQKQPESVVIFEGELITIAQSKNKKALCRSVKQMQEDERKLFSTSSPSRNKSNKSREQQLQNLSPANSSLPLFMKSHIQKQANKIYVENSPERKTHDNMLIRKRQKGSDIQSDRFNSTRFKSDEANVLEKAKSSKIMKSETYNDVWIAK